MILWGLVSMAMMFIKSTGLYTMRFLLSAAEAGFFRASFSISLIGIPPKRADDRSFAMGGVIAGVVGSPISGYPRAEWSGWPGWLAMALSPRGIPPCSWVSSSCLLPSRPENARWLSDTEKTWIHARMAEEAARSGNPPTASSLKKRLPADAPGFFA